MVEVAVVGDGELVLDLMLCGVVTGGLVVNVVAGSVIFVVDGIVVFVGWYWRCMVKWRFFIFLLK